MKEEKIITYLKECIEHSRYNFENFGENNYLDKSTQNAIQGLLDLYEKEKEKNNKALELAFQYGQIDGGHHKTWVIDQIVRTLTENDYDKWVQHYEYDKETGEYYTWDIGIAP